MNAKDVMTTGVISVPPETPVSRAVGMMLQYDISGFPVVERGGKLVGIVTEGDFLRRAETGTEPQRRPARARSLDTGRLAEEYIHAHARTVGQVMSREVVTVAEDAPLGEVADLMDRHRIRRVPVMRAGAVVGMVSRRDLLHAFAVCAKRAVPPPGDDRAIRDRILDEIGKELWVPPVPVNVSVAEGVVELRGAVMHERQREALRVLAENVPGVKRVRDRLVWVGVNGDHDV
jgi:CBS domain-containing protein